MKTTIKVSWSKNKVAIRDNEKTKIKITKDETRNIKELRRRVEPK